MKTALIILYSAVHFTMFFYNQISCHICTPFLDRCQRKLRAWTFSCVTVLYCCKWQVCKGFIGVRLILAPKGKDFSPGESCERSFMGNTREHQFLQAQQPVPTMARVLANPCQERRGKKIPEKSRKSNKSTEESFMPVKRFHSFSI